MWTCVISLYQIITIINTENYKLLYGNDPLAKWSDEKKPDIEKLKFFPNPDLLHYASIKKHKLNNRLITTISMTSGEDIFQKEFNNLQHQMGSKNRLIGVAFYNEHDEKQKF